MQGPESPISTLSVQVNGDIWNAGRGQLHFSQGLFHFHTPAGVPKVKVLNLGGHTL